MKPSRGRDATPAEIRLAANADRVIYERAIELLRLRIQWRNFAIWAACTGWIITGIIYAIHLWNER